MALLAVALTDEFWSGVAVVAAPAVEDEHGLEHRGYALLVFAVPFLLSSLLEAGFALLSDRVPRRRLIALGLLGLAASLGLCAWAPSVALLALGLGCAGTASGVACGAAQAELVTHHPLGAERALTRWVLFGAIGDVLTPLVLAGVLALGGSYRAALWASALVIALQALLVLRSPPTLAPKGDDADDDEPHEPLWRALGAAARDRRLWLWCFGAALCTLLDEIVIALTTLHLERDLHLPVASAAGYATALSLGGVLGAFLSERALARVSSTRVLVVSALGCVLALGVVIASDTIEWIAPALVLLGVACAPQYALLLARAHAVVPGRPGIVNALSEVFVLVDILAPIALGAIADALGLELALGCLLLQPLGVLGLLLALRDRRARPRRSAEGGLDPEP
jgi:MFS transporter, FSR family, fosmidomycin resistance protein